MSTAAAWYDVLNADDVASPALLIYPERIEENIRRMVAIAGGPERLCPHVKTHKMSAVVRMHLQVGITMFKCAMIAEAEMVAGCGAAEVLIAYQLVGPNVRRLVELVRRFPDTRFSTIVDHPDPLRELSQALAAGCEVDVLLDVDNGMGRCGIQPGSEAIELYAAVAALPGVRPGGLHVYDGHVRDHDLESRRNTCHAAFAPVEALREQLLQRGLAVPCVVAGGTPTFPIHAEHADRLCSPGTCVLWDAGYAAMFPDLDFLHAAVVMSRVISKPAADVLCLDLGHKAVAPDPPQPRVVFPALPDAVLVMHSEEHLAVRTAAAAALPIGSIVYGIPAHVCPTCALHAEAVVVKGNRAAGHWPIEARDRTLTI